LNESIDEYYDFGFVAKISGAGYRFAAFENHTSICLFIDLFKAE